MNLLLAARQTFLLVSGEHKREILWKTVKGPIIPDVPSSYLQQGKNITIITDQAAWPYAEENENSGANGKIHI